VADTAKVRHCIGELRRQLERDGNVRLDIRELLARDVPSLCDELDLLRTEVDLLHRDPLAALSPEVREVVEDTVENWRRGHGE
jgi:hypothetical protein